MRRLAALLLMMGCAPDPITEIVLTRFRGELVLLDSRGSGAAAGAAADEEGGQISSGRSGEFGRSSAMI